MTTSEMPLWPQPDVPGEPAKSSGSGKKLAIGAAALLLACCGGASLLRFFGGGGDEGGQRAASAPMFVQPSVVPSATPEPSEDVPEESAEPEEGGTSTSASPSRSKAKKSSKPVETTDVATSKPATSSPAPSPSTSKPQTPDVQQDIRIGDTCSPRNAVGQTSDGDYAVCRPSQRDNQLRWRPV